MEIILKNIIDAFVDDGNVMVVLKNADGGKTVFVEEENVHQSFGHPVEILPTTHKLYTSVVEKFNLNV